MRRPIYSTALGKAMAAFLPEEKRTRIVKEQLFQSLTHRTILTAERLHEELDEVRRLGWAIDEEESVLGARCVSVPIPNARQESLAAISVAGPTTRLSLEGIPDIVAAVRTAARSVSIQLGF